MTAAENADKRRPDPADLVEIADFPTGGVEAELFAGRLEAMGIRAFKFGTAADVLGFLEAGTTRHGGIQVQVRREDEARARQVLEEFNAEKAEDDGMDAAGDLGL
ncbi:MAG: hypothetical protein ACOC0P_03285, partial [Planctomycetota bacterium]